MYIHTYTRHDTLYMIDLSNFGLSTKEEKKTNEFITIIINFLMKYFYYHQLLIRLSIAALISPPESIRAGK